MRDPEGGPMGGAAMATTRPGTRAMVMPQPGPPVGPGAPRSPTTVTVAVGRPIAAPAPAQGPSPAIYALPTPGAMPKPPPAQPGPGPTSGPRMPQPPASGPPRPEAPKRLVKSTQTLSRELRACYPPKGPIAAYLEWVHKLTHAPPQLHLAAILPVIANEANRRRWILSNGEPLNIWTFVLCGSGIGKTSCLRYAKELHNDWGQAVTGQSWRDPWESIEGSLPGVADVLMRKHYDESSASTSAILHHNETSKIMRGEENLEWFCQLYDRGDLKRNLRYIQKAQSEGQEAPDTIRNPKISALFLTTQPSFQEVFRESTMRGGFASRLLWFTGKVTGDQLMPMQLTDEVGRAKVLRTFIEWTKTLDGLSLMQSGTGYQNDRPIILSERAEALHTSYFDSDLRALIVGENQAWCSIANRASTYALRVAALYALVNGRTEITEEEMSCAIALMRYLFRGLETLLPQIAPEDRFQRQRRLISEVAEDIAAKAKNALVSRAAILRKVRLSVAEFDIVARTLVEEDFWQDVTPRFAGHIGRPTRYYELLEKT